jgi:hypothetical protein
MNEEGFEQEREKSPTAPANRWLLILTVLLLFATVGGFIYASRERSRADQLAAGYDQLSLTLNQTRSQLDAVTAKLSALTTAPKAEPAPPEVEPKPAVAKPQKAETQTKATVRQRAEEQRWKDLQSQLAEHQKQIDAARRDVETARTELEGKLNSSYGELDGKIARNHDELVALQKRGERDYHEFGLVKSKQFQRVGPISLALRKAHTKKQYADLHLLVDDMRLEKKHINLYEPVLLYPADYGQPLELVINQIDKDLVHGYVSEPRYRQGGKAASAQTPAPAAAAVASTSPELERRSGPLN